MGDLQAPSEDTPRVATWRVALFVIWSGLSIGSIFSNTPVPILQMYANITHTFDPAAHDAANDSIVSAIVAAFFVGSMAGSLLAPLALARYTRKACVLCFVGATLVLSALTCIPVHYGYLIALRFLTGVPGAMQMTTVSMWVSELSRPRIRGIMTVTLQFANSFGLLVNYLLMLAIGPHDRLWWLVPGFTTLCLLCCLLSVLLIRPLGVSSGGPAVELRRTAIEECASGGGAGTGTDTDARTSTAPPHALIGGRARPFRDRRYRKALLLAVVLPLSQQGSGINAVIAFANTLFQRLPLENAASVGAVLIAAWNFVASVIAFPIVERRGRRLLWFTGSFLMLGALAAFAVLYGVESAQASAGAATTALLLLAMGVYLIGFQMSSGPLLFTVCGEVFPPEVRALFSGVAFTCHRLYCTVVVFTFPFMHRVLYAAFLAYLVLEALATGLSWFLLPETKGKTLDEISELVQHDAVFVRYTLTGERRGAPPSRTRTRGWAVPLRRRYASLR